MLNYKLYGSLQDSDYPLVVLHGLLGALDNWYTFARSQEGKRAIVAIDLRNHGNSPHVEGMSYREMVSDIVEVLDALHIQHCDLMGHSMGGKVAMVLALQHPSLIHQLIIVDIAPKTYPPRHQALIQAMVSMPLHELTSRKQADEWLSPVVKHPFERGFLLKNLGRSGDGKFYWLCNLPEIARHYLKISSFPQLEAIYQGEVLVIRGGQSDYVSDEDLALIQTKFPQVQLETVEASGHLPHVQTPEIFTQLVENFLA